MNVKLAPHVDRWLPVPVKQVVPRADVQNKRLKGPELVSFTASVKLTEGLCENRCCGIDVELMPVCMRTGACPLQRPQGRLCPG